MKSTAERKKSNYVDTIQLSARRPWVVVWAPQSNNYARVPSTFDRSKGGHCLFDQAIEVAKVWGAADQIVPVVLRPHRPWWDQTVSGLPQENVAEQPFDRGSAAGILLAILRIYRRDPLARIILLSAHGAAVQVNSPLPAPESTNSRDDLVVVARSAPGRRPIKGRREVSAFHRVHGEWQKSRMPHDGLVVASAANLVQLFIDNQPELTGQFLSKLQGAALFDNMELDQLYPYLPETDFQAEVLGRSIRRAEAVERTPRVRVNRPAARMVSL